MHSTLKYLSQLIKRSVPECNVDYQIQQSGEAVYIVITINSVGALSLLYNTKSAAAVSNFLFNLVNQPI